MTEVPTLNPEPGDSGEFDIADDQLICDTGMMKIPAAFHPDPDLDIKPSRLAQQGDRQSVNDDDDLPTLSPVADDLPAATMPQTDDEDDAPDTEDLVSLEAEPTAIFEKPEFELPPSDDLSEMPKIEKIRHSIADAERAATRASATEPALEPAEAAPSASMSPARPTQAATAHQAALRPASSYNPIPDLDKLEAAISAARRSEPDGAPARSLCLSPTPDEPVTADNQQQAATLAVVAEPEIEQSKLAIPEITLDQTLEDQRKEGEKLDAMAAELANIDSLDEISDLMAETLFGQEFEQFAAEALANPPARGTLPGEEHETDVEHATMYAIGGNPETDESV
jgi:hypothetical protein